MREFLMELGEWWPALKAFVRDLVPLIPGIIIVLLVLAFGLSWLWVITGWWGEKVRKKRHDAWLAKYKEEEDQRRQRWRERLYGIKAEHDTTTEQRAVPPQSQPPQPPASAGPS